MLCLPAFTGLAINFRPSNFWWCSVCIWNDFWVWWIFDELAFEFDEVVKKLQIDENSSQTSLKIKNKIKIIFSLISFWDFFCWKKVPLQNSKKRNFLLFLSNQPHKGKRKKFWKPWNLFFYFLLKSFNLFIVVFLKWPRPEKWKVSKNLKKLLTQKCSTKVLV